MKISDIKIGKRFRRSMGDLDKLIESIKAVGLLHPPAIDEKNNLICGQRRIEAYKKMGLKEIPVTVVNLQDIILGEIHENTIRENFTWEEIMEIKEAVEPKIKQERNKGGRGKKRSSKLDEVSSRTDEKLAKYLSERGRKVGKDTLRKVQEVYNARSKHPELWEELNNEQIKPEKAVNILQHESRREQARKDAFDADWKKTMGTDKYQLLQGGIEKMGEKIQTAGVDLIFTDPPYLGETLDVYKDLGRLANRVLKPGGSLVTIVGHHYIFRVHEMLTDGTDLQYHWMIVLRHGGHARRVHAYGVWAHYKPILWYYKPKVKSQKPTMYHDMADLVESKPVDKALHKWEQSVIEAKHFIQSLTVERQLVLDPFLGSGSTGVAALQMNRRFRGIEIDPETMKIAAKRLSEI